MAEFKSVSLADQVFFRLEQDIINGVYTRGEILTELKLVEQLGVSRTPIREALRRLEQERLIKDSGKGSVVLGITVEDLIDIMDVRQHIEGLAAYHATQNITPQELAEMRQINELQEFYYQKQDLENLRQMDDRFHTMLYEVCKRTVICDTLQPLHRKIQRYRKLSLSSRQRQAHTLKEHTAIFQAIAQGDAELAAELTTKHIEKAKIHMIERFEYHGKNHS